MKTRLNDVVMRAMSRERLVQELVNRARQLGAVSIELRQARNLVQELNSDGRRQPNGKPWKRETKRYRRGLLSYNAKLTGRVEWLEETILKCRKKLMELMA